MNRYRKYGKQKALEVYCKKLEKALDKAIDIIQSNISNTEFEVVDREKIKEYLFKE